MKTIVVNDFGGGIANDIYTPNPAEAAVTKHFDISTYPNRLSPVRTMAADQASYSGSFHPTTATSIGNLVLGSNGQIFGVGSHISSPTLQGIWKKNGASNSAYWEELVNFTGGVAGNYDLFISYPGAGTYSLLYGAGNKICWADPNDGSIGSQRALTYTSITQGFIHPKDNFMYFGYKTASGTFIGSLNGNPATPGNWTDIALTLPSQLTVAWLSYYGNNLAIGCYDNLSNKSVMYLWDRDPLITILPDPIPWGDGRLQVVNNLNGVLIGISDLGNPGIFGGNTVTDYDAIQIKGYAGGEPQLLKEIPASVFNGTSPATVVNPRVNFIYRDKMYFSINVVGGDIGPAYGLWCLGKSKTSGRYFVNLERYATSDNSETGVIAALLIGDYATMVHTTEGTITSGSATTNMAVAFASTSIFESVINPSMEGRYYRLDRTFQKQLISFAVRYVPLQGTVSAYYRVDATSGWTRLFTETTSGVTATEVLYEVVSGQKPSAGRDYQFRLESSGGAQIIGYSYKYDVLETNI